jgi:hypothetical protein
MYAVSEISTSTLTIYYSGHCDYAAKSQAVVVNPKVSQLDDAYQILLTIDFHEKVKKLGLIMNSKPKRFLLTEATMDNVTMHTNTNSSEAGNIADRSTVPVL